MRPWRLTLWRNRSAGFTLTEVLVAVAVLSIALMASLRLINQQTRFSAGLEERVLAHWVAMNGLAERQLGVPISGEVESGGILWTVEGSEAAGPAGLTRVEFRVASDGHAGALIVGYLRPDAPDGPRQ